MKINELVSIVKAVKEATNLPQEDVIDAVVPSQDGTVLLSLIEDLFYMEDAPGPHGTTSLKQTLVDCVVAYLHHVFEY